jgi:hypothetical protein
MESSGFIPQIPKQNCIFAVPKKGRLYEQCMKLLAGAGLEHTRVSQLRRQAMLTAGAEILETCEKCMHMECQQQSN